MENSENKIIFDEKIKSIQDLYNILLNNSYDFLILEPLEDKCSIKFRKEWKVVEEKFIKQNIYNEIVIKAKTLSNLDVWITNEEQEWKWKIELNWKNFEILSKVVPSKAWEKLFLKLKEIKETKKWTSQSVGFWQFIWFLLVVLIVLLIVWNSYIAFIILNAKTIDDVKFFLSLWINLNDINYFLKIFVKIFFLSLTFILTIFLIIFLSKFLLTKKIFKKKKAKYLVLSILFFILTFGWATFWIFLDRKVDELPRWDILALWDIIVYDNWIYNSEAFEDEKNKKNRESSAHIEDTSNIIWPINLRFDINWLIKKRNFTWEIQKYIWHFWNWEDSIETLDPILPEKIFTKKWNYNLEVDVELIDLVWNRSKETLKTSFTIWIPYVVSITEKELNSWLKQITFDASTMKNLWKIKWFFWEDWSEAKSEWPIFIHRWVFDETQVKMAVWDDKKLSRVFVIKWNSKKLIDWEILFETSPYNDRDVTLTFGNQKLDEWIWFIEEYEWQINDKVIKKDWRIDEPEKSSEIKHNFRDYWRYNISVKVKTSNWQVEKITKNIEIKRKLKIKEWIKFYSDWEELKGIKHNSKTWEYFINDFWTPAKLEMDARYVKSDNIIYSLDEVNFDYDSDWTIDEKSKKWQLQINKEWRNKITVNYIFKNIKIDEKIEVKEMIYIEAVKKDYEIILKINKPSEYAPVIVWFDASKSYIKWWNITKFIWSYGDWIKEEWDSVVKWHRYLTDWEYNIWLTIVWEDWKKYSKNEKLIIKPKAQKLKISSSLKEAPTFQWIDFSSSESVWDIESYLWDFGDGEISTEANPTHRYEKPGNYEVKLTWEFRNRNIMSESIKITIIN